MQYINTDTNNAKSKRKKIIFNIISSNQRLDTHPGIYKDFLEFQKVYNIKDGIDKYYSIFSNFIKYTNDYELVNTSRIPLAVPNINTINRAFFKVWEIYKRIKTNVQNPNPIIYAGLAESPGGFMQATMYYRNKYIYNTNTLTHPPSSFHDIPVNKDKYYGISLRQARSREKIPWKIEKRRNIIISYGDPNIADGNIMNPANIVAFSNEFTENKADLVTADGGILISNHLLENYKEQIHTPLFLSEMIIALMILRAGGDFIIKVYDILTYPTIQLVYVLSLFFSSIFIIKPFTSRPANSEKYIVCVDYVGSNNTMNKKLMSLAYNIYNIIGDNLEEVHIKSFINIEVPSDIIWQLRIFNKEVINNQILEIEKTIDLIKIQQEQKYKFNEFINNRKRIQIDYAIKWCNKYDIPIKEKYTGEYVKKYKKPRERSHNATREYRNTNGDINRYKDARGYTNGYTNGYTKEYNNKYEYHK